MYHRYGQQPRGSRSRQQLTFILLLVLALAIACISLTVAYSGAARANANTRQELINRIQAEVNQARQRAYQLSQTGGSKSESMVAMVRQHVYAARTINEMTSAIYGAGNVLVTETLINNCVADLDQCDQKLQTGSVTTDTYTSLRTNIDALLEDVSYLE